MFEGPTWLLAVFGVLAIPRRGTVGGGDGARVLVYGKEVNGG